MDFLQSVTSSVSWGDLRKKMVHFNDVKKE